MKKRTKLLAAILSACMMVIPVSAQEYSYRGSAASTTDAREFTLGTLRSMQITLLNTASGYIPSCTRTKLTDALYKIFGFRTDYEFITKSSMRTIIKNEAD